MLLSLLRIQPIVFSTAFDQAPGFKIENLKYRNKPIKSKQGKWLSYRETWKSVKLELMIMIYIFLT